MTNKNINPFKKCPVCNKNWRYEVKREGKKKKEVYSHLIGIEVPEMYDGISFWQCPYCKTEWSRFNGEITSKLIKGYEDYKIFNDGRIYSIKNKVYLKPTIRNGGYLHLNLNGETKDVHRLVAENFIKNPLGKPQVNHKDGDKKNNNYSNLEWVTPSENGKHAFKNGLLPHLENQTGDKNHNSKLNYKKAKKIRELYSLGKTQEELAEMFGVGDSTISQVILNRTWVK